MTAIRLMMTWPVGARIAIGAGILAIFGSVLPWISVSVGRIAVSAGGTAGGGLIALVAATALVGAVAATVTWPATPWWTACLAAVVLLAVAIGDMVNAFAGTVVSVRDSSGAVVPLSGTGVTVAPGVGLWIVTVAALAGLGGSVLLAERGVPEPELLEDEGRH